MSSNALRLRTLDSVTSGPISNGRLSLLTFGISFPLIWAGSWVPALSGDESASVVVVRRTWTQVLRVWTFDAALEPYYLVLKSWAALTSSLSWTSLTSGSPGLLRLPSVLAMAAAVTVLVLLARAAVDLRTGLFAGAILLTMPSVSRFGQDARPYAFALLFAVLAVSMWWHYLRLGQLRFGVAYAGSLCLAGLVHAYSLTLVIALLVAALLTARGAGWTPVLRTVAPATVSLVLLTPFLVFVARFATGQLSVPEVSPYSIAYAAAALPSAVLSPPAGHGLRRARDLGESLRTRRRTWQRKT